MVCRVFDACCVHVCAWRAMAKVAWLFNIRGSDVVFNPVPLSAALLTQEAAFLFIDGRKLSEDVKKVRWALAALECVALWTRVPCCGPRVTNLSDYWPEGLGG